MKVTKKKLSAVQKIIMNARSFNAMLSGEIPAGDGIVVTDGLALLYSPISFGLAKCMSSDAAAGGGVTRQINPCL